MLIWALPWSWFPVGTLSWEAMMSWLYLWCFERWSWMNSVVFGVHGLLSTCSSRPTLALIILPVSGALPTFLWSSLSRDSHRLRWPATLNKFATLSLSWRIRFIVPSSYHYSLLRSPPQTLDYSSDLYIVLLLVHLFIFLACTFSFELENHFPPLSWLFVRSICSHLTFAELGLLI